MASTAETSGLTAGQKIIKRVARAGSTRLTRLATFVALVAIIAAGVLAIPQTALAASACIQDGDGSFVKDICITAPQDGDTVSGTITVVGTVDPVNGPRTQKVEFYLDNEYVLTDFRSSETGSAVFDFELPTEFWVDGTHRLEMQAITRAEPNTPSYTTKRVGIDLVFDNGITQVPPNTNTFTPSQGRPTTAGEAFTVAAVGDGASGEPNAEAVADLLYGKQPNMFLYLGDVYEKGTRTEFHNWYGDETRSWGRLRSITNPTIGNHEYENGAAPGYFDYWDNVPNFYSYDVAGWHLINLNSTNAFRDSPEQLNWLLADIEANDAKCTIAYWHDPRWSIGTQGDEPAMQEEWEALVAAGVDVFLGGNDHNYQRWEPLGPDGQLDPDGAVQFVAGSGGHGIRPFAPGQSEANPRVARASDSLDTFGALFLDLHADRADFRYLQANGGVLDEGTIPCRDDASFRESLQGTRDALDAAVGELSGSAKDKARGAVAELDKTLNDDDHWDANGAPSDSEGKDVFEKVKKAAEKLREVDTPPAPIGTALDSLVAISAEMAQARIDAAIAANGDPWKLLEAMEHMDKALEKLAQGEQHRAIEEYKKAWEKARGASSFDAVGFRGEYLDIANSLVAATPSLSGKAEDKAREAVKELSSAYADDKVWDAAGMPSDEDGKNAFEQAQKAVEKLREVDTPPAPIVTGIDTLVALSELMAQTQIDATVAAGGDQSKIEDALEHMDKALQKLANGEPHKAIEEYKKAWEKASDAL